MVWVLGNGVVVSFLFVELGSCWVAELFVVFVDGLTLVSSDFVVDNDVACMEMPSCFVSSEEPTDIPLVSSSFIGVESDVVGCVVSLVLSFVSAVRIFVVGGVLTSGTRGAGLCFHFSLQFCGLGLKIRPNQW